MDILFLDDSPIRTEKFRTLIPSAVFVQTAAECIEKIKEKKWDFVFLDHDLGGKIHVDTEEKDTGSEVVRWIVENNPWIDEIILHTLNRIAGESMRNQLIEADYRVSYQPFHWMIENDSLFEEIYKRMEDEIHE